MFFPFYEVTESSNWTYCPSSTSYHNAFPYFARLSFSDTAYRVLRWNLRLFKPHELVYVNSSVVRSRWIGANKKSYESRRVSASALRDGRAVCNGLQERNLLWRQTSVQVAGVWWSAALRDARSSAGAPAARWGLIVRAGVSGG